MIDHFMCVLVKPVVGFQSVSVQGRASADVITHDGLQVALAPRPNVVRTDLPGLAFEQAKYNGLTHRSTPLDLFSALIGVHEARRASYECLVGLDRASHLVNAPGVHRVADAMIDEPCCPLRDLQIPTHFVTADSVLAV